MSKKYCQQCPVCNQFTDNLITHVNSHFEKESISNKLVLRSKLPTSENKDISTILKSKDGQAIILKSKNKHSIKEQSQTAQTTQKNLLLPLSLQDDLLLPKTLQDDLLLPLSLQDDLLLPKTLQDDLLVPKNLQDNILLPQTLQDDLLLAQTLQDDLFVAQTLQDDFLVAQTLQEEDENYVFNKSESDFLIALELQMQNNENRMHENFTLEEENTAILNKCENDFLLASELQSYENEVNEKEDFKKLQAMYGMNSSSGFMKQFDVKTRKDVGKSITVSDYYNKKSDMLSSLMEGKDNLETSTKGVINALKNHMYGAVGVKAFILSCNVTHFGISIADRGWGCGYRNIQMLISSIFEHDQYKLKEIMSDIPSIPKIQALIEKAWNEGYDQAGKEQLNGKLQGTRKWIGTTEVCALLRSFKLKAQIVDFHKPNSAENLHVLMMEWICDYFHKGCKLPLYLQHQGHSRLCIGIEEHDKECFLLLLDPSTSIKQMENFINSQSRKNTVNYFRKSIRQLRQKEFQVLYIDGTFSLPNEIQESKFISSIRIP